MIKFFANKPNPSPEKNFLDNYLDHFNFLTRKFEATYEQLKQEKGVGKQLFFLLEEALKRVHILEQLRDGHDYLDDVLGATILPYACVIASVALAAVSFWEGIQTLAISAGWMKDDINHSDNAARYLLLAGSALVYSVLIQMASLTSLISRPIITLLCDWKKQDIDRFYRAVPTEEEPLSETELSETEQEEINNMNTNRSK